MTIVNYFFSQASATSRDWRKKNNKTRIVHLEASTNEGLTCREIAQRIEQTPAVIRNLRYKKKLGYQDESESKVLFQQRDELSIIVGIAISPDDLQKVCGGNKTSIGK